MRAIKLSVIFAIINIFTFSSCSQWRVSDLGQKTLFTVKNGSDPKQASISIGQNGLLDLTFDVHASKERIFLSDNRLKRLQVFDTDGNLVCLISGKKNEPFQGASQFNFGIIGEIVSDSEGKIYVQNRIDVSTAAAKQQGDIGVNPSFILVFDKTGHLQYTMGQKGTAEIPFYNIESAVIDMNDRLWIVSKNYDTWSVYRFKSRYRDFNATFGKDNFGSEKEGSNTYNGVIENITPYHDGSKFLISVSYYHNTRFKYRKIYEYNTNENRVGKIILQLPDPKNELFTILDGKYLLLWDTEEKNLRFAIWDFDGNIVNNLRIRMEKERSQLFRVMSDEKGKIFSYSVKKTGIEISEWK